MLSILLTSVLLFTLIGCESKEYKKEQNSNIEIVSELNKRDSESVISKLESKDSLTPRERSYLASAYSEKGGVDVFSLYNVLEMQLFKKSALEWSDLSKEKNPYVKFMGSQANLDKKKRLEKREKRFEKYKESISQKMQITKEKPTLEEIEIMYNGDLTEEQYEEADKLVLGCMDKAKEGPAEHEERSKIFNKCFYLDRQADYLKNPVVGYLVSYYWGVLELDTVKEAYLNPEGKPKSLFKGSWQMLYMNILWNTYESIPVMKQLPSLSDEQQEAITTAIEQYQFLVEDPEFKDVALKNILVLSGVSLLSIYKSGFDFEEVNSIEDLMCTFEPEAILENYNLVRERIMVLAKTAQKIGDKKLIEEYEEYIQKLEESMPIELSPEKKESFIRTNEEFKVNSCFIS